MAVSKQTLEYALRQTAKQQTNVKSARERGRQSRATAKAREQHRQATQAQKAQLQVETARQRETIKAEAAQERAEARQSSKPSLARRSGISTTGAIKSAGSTAASTSVGSLILLVMFIMGGLLVFYNLVAHPKSTSTRAGQLGDWLAVLSTDKPLFTKVSK